MPSWLRCFSLTKSKILQTSLNFYDSGAFDDLPKGSFEISEEFGVTCVNFVFNIAMKKWVIKFEIRWKRRSIAISSAFKYPTANVFFKVFWYNVYLVQRSIWLQIFIKLQRIVIARIANLNDRYTLKNALCEKIFSRKKIIWFFS